MTSPLINGKGKACSSSAHHVHKSQKKHRKPVGVVTHKYIKQFPTKFATQDIDKVIHFFKTEKGPHKTLTIARACGYGTKGQINPILYHMEKRKFIEKIKENPPVWILLPGGLNIPINVGVPRSGSCNPHSPSKYQEIQYHSINNCQPGRVHNFGNYRERNNQNRNNEARHNNNTLIGIPARSTSKHESFSHGHLSMKEAACGGNLFTKSISDTTAPGAYRAQGLDHSHEKHMDTNIVHRKDVPSCSKSEPVIKHEGASFHAAACLSASARHFESTVTASEFLIDSNAQTSVESEKSFPFSKNLDYSDYSDNEEYDLNFRISDVVSIRDPDFRADMHVKSVTESCEDGEGSDIQTQEMTDLCGAEESDHGESWVGGRNFGATFIPKILRYETDAKTVQKIIDSNLLKVLSLVPLKSTLKSYLASELKLPQGDFEKLLDICCKEGWIDYSELGHVRLTELGIHFLFELEKLGRDTALHQNACRPIFPDEVLKSNSAFENIFTVSEKQQNACTSQVLQSQNNNPIDSGESKQMKLTQEINSKEKNMMPWLLVKAPLVNSEQVTSAGELSARPSQSAPPSISRGMLSLQTSSLSSPRKPSTNEQHLLGANKVNIQVVGKYASADFSNQRMLSLPFATFSSLQDSVQQKRPPLLTTPDVIRGSSSFLKISPTLGKVPLLPSPGQPIQNLNHQLQVHQQDTPTNLQISTESFAALNKNPISAFMEYGQCRHTPARIEVVSQRGPPHKPVFTIAAVLGARVFPGITSSNKKDGKKDAAEQAIRILIAEGQYNMPVNSNAISIPESSMTQFDKIAALTHHKFNQLIATIPESLVGRKVIAGLIMKVNDADTGTVVAIGSGNRCITGDKLSLRGLTVNDSHAEIITRRGFVRFLYSQLRSYDPNKDHPLFEKSSTGKLRIKYTVTFHLYISTAPCGDGALFSPRDVESNNAALTDSCTMHRPTFETNVQGVLRTKMEGGEGTIPVDLEKPVQTWDGIVRGERLRTMSCSDKICRWNVLGLQGALLANILDPIYLSSITLGFLFDAGHLSRAVCCRLTRGEPPLDSDLPFPYNLNHPVLGRVTACDATRETQKTKSYSINWMVEDDKPEIIDGCQGACYTGDKNEPPQPSRLCKKNMFDNFRQTCQVLKCTELLNAPVYSVAKTMSPEFQQAKAAMIQKFKTTNCGMWLGKPVEEEMFA